VPSHSSLEYSPADITAFRRISLTIAAAVAVAVLTACSGTSPAGATSPGSGASGASGASGGTGSGAGASATGPGSASTTQPAPRQSPLATPSEEGVRAVLGAFEAIDAHGPYRITMTTGGERAFLDVVPPGSAHYYVRAGATVGEEIEVDGAVWVRGADGRWTPTDGMTQTAPRLTVADIAHASQTGQSTAGGRTYRTYRLTGSWHDEPLAATAEVWADRLQLRQVRLATSAGTTDYAFDYTARPIITAPTP